MKYLTIAAFVTAQVLATTQPAFAAEFAENRTHHMGAFAGFRLRMPLDGNAQQRQVRASLALAPTMHSRAMNRESRLRIGEGLEFGRRGHEPVRLSIADQDLRRLGAQQGDEDTGDDDDGIPTWVWIAGGVVVAAGVGLALFVDAMNDASE